MSAALSTPAFAAIVWTCSLLILGVGFLCGRWSVRKKGSRE